MVKHKQLPKRLKFARRTQIVHYCVRKAQEGKGYVVLQYAKKPSKYPFSYIIHRATTRNAAEKWLAIHTTFKG